MFPGCWSEMILLVEEILHRLIGTVSWYLRVFYIPGSVGFLPSTVVIPCEIAAIFSQAQLLVHVSNYLAVFEKGSKTNKTLRGPPRARGLRGLRGPAGPGGSSYNNNNNSSSSSSSGSISFNLYFVLLRSTYFGLYNSRCTACYNSTTLRAILQNTTTYYCNVSTNQSILQITILRTTTVWLGTTRAVILRTTTLWLCTAITCYMLRATRTQNVQYNARSNLWDAKNTVTTTFMLQ